tara:strand:+ start:480 stop:695 length:216 start_codon:yes stop_codon:yes gene_type:complete
MKSKETVYHISKYHWLRILNFVIRLGYKYEKLFDIKSIKEDWICINHSELDVYFPQKYKQYCFGAIEVAQI